MTTATTTLREIKCHMADNFSRNLNNLGQTNGNFETGPRKPKHAHFRKQKSKKRKKTWMEGENENLSKTSRASS